MSIKDQVRKVPSPPSGERARVRGQPRHWGKHRTRTPAAREFARHLLIERTGQKEKISGCMPRPAPSPQHSPPMGERESLRRVFTDPNSC